MKRKNFITIGTFDGVHTGHRFLFNRLEMLAVEHRLKPLVLFFPYPPKTLLSEHPEMTMLTTPKEKQKMLKELEGARIRELDFQTYHNYTPEQFFKKILMEKYRMGGLVVGKDFAFGKDRAGHIGFLREQCAKYNIPFEVVNFYTAGGMKISSSLIRKTLAEGDIPQANMLLGRPYSLQGRVITGHRLGRKLGYPTANLDTGIHKILPHGVFAVWVKAGTKLYKGFCNIGFRPTVNPVNARLPLVEVNIFNFKRSIYGRTITIWFEDKIRAEKKFDGLPALIAQLKADKKEAMRLLKNKPTI